MSESDDVHDWQERLRKAQTYQEAHGRVENWKRARQWYDGNYGDEVFSVNHVFAIGRGLVPQLYFKNPVILVKALAKAGVDQQRATAAARILEAIDAWLIPHIGLKQQIKLGITDAYTTNLGVFKVGYHSVGSEFPRQAAGDSLTQQMIDQAGDLLGPPAAESLATEQEEQRRYSYHDWVRADSPWVLRTNPGDFLVPDESKDPQAIPWCAFRVVRPLEDIQADPVYRESVTRHLEANTGRPIKDASGVRSPAQKGEGMGAEDQDPVELFEIWDKRDGTVRVVCEGVDKFLREDRHDLPMTGLPVMLLQFNPVGWDFWGPSDVQQIYKQVTELNETRTLEMLHKRTAVAKFLFDSTMIDDAELEKFTQGKIAAIKLKGPPASAVMQLTPQMSRDLFAVSQELERDIRSVVGFGRNQQGEFDRSSRRTAQEVATVQQNLQLRADERRDQVADLLGELFQFKIHPLLFTFWTTPRVIEVSGLPGWVEYTNRDIRGDYQVMAVADSVVPLSRNLRQQTAILAFRTFKGDPRIDQRRLYEAVLSPFEDTLPKDLLVPQQQYQQTVQQQGTIQQLLAMAKARPHQPTHGGGNGSRAPASAIGGAG